MTYTIDDNMTADSDAQSATSGLTAAELSALEEETDDFGKRILEYQREQLRRSRRTVTRPPQRDSTTSQGSAATRTYERRPDDYASRLRARTQNVISDSAHPPVNIPSEWGRKQRARIDLTRKTVDKVESRSRESAIIQSSGVDQWMLETQKALPSVELNSGLPNVDNNMSLHHLNTTFAADDVDFSSISMLTSTPAVKTLAQQANVKVHGPAANVRPTTALPVNRPAEGFHLPREILQTTGDPLPRRRRSLYGNKENVKPQDLKHHVSEDKGADAITRRTLNPVTFKNAAGKEHKRTDSHNLLRQLARASLSPSPARDGAGANVLHHEEIPVEVASPLAVKSIEKAKTSHQYSDATKPADTIGSRAAALRQPQSETLINTRMKPDLWSDVVDVKTLPEFPIQRSSALQDIIAESNGKSDGFLGEATLDSLREVLATGNLDGNVTATDDLSATLKQLSAQIEQDDDVNKNAASEATDEDKNRNIERIDTSKPQDNINAEENKATQVHRMPVLATLQEFRKGATTKKQLRKALVSTQCESCIASGQSLWKGLWNEFAGCFYRSSPGIFHEPKLTWLGLTCVVLVIWILSELALCKQVCQPRYATQMSGYGVNPSAPEFPYVIPTLLLRPFWTIWSPVWYLFLWISRIVLWMFGSDIGQSSRTHMTRSTARATNNAIGVAGDTQGLWDDNFWY